MHAAATNGDMAWLSAANNSTLSHILVGCRQVQGLYSTHGGVPQKGRVDGAEAAVWQASDAGMLDQPKQEAAAVSVAVWVHSLSHRISQHGYDNY